MKSNHLLHNMLGTKAIICSFVIGPNSFVVGLQPLGISVVRRKTLWKNLQTNAELCLLLKYLQALPGSFTLSFFSLLPVKWSCGHLLGSPSRDVASGDLAEIWKKFQVQKLSTWGAESKTTVYSHRSERRKSYARVLSTASSYQNPVAKYISRM